MGLTPPDVPADFWPWDLDPNYQPHQRASALNNASVCPAYMFLGQAEKLRKKEHGSEYTSIGQIGHKWIELRLQTDEKVAAAYAQTNKKNVPEGFLWSLRDFWKWLVDESGLLLPGAEVLTEESLCVRLGPCTVTGHADLVQIAEEDEFASVADWKFYQDPRMLPPIGEDLQMYLYGLAVSEMVPAVKEVHVHRVLCYHLEAETLCLTPEALRLARVALKEAVEKIWDSRTTFCPGGHCVSCLLRRSCPAYRSFESTFDASEIAPYRAGKIASEKQALAFLLAAKQVEERIEAGKKACKEFVGEHGPITDEASGMQWGPRASGRDAIQSPAAAIGQLGELVGDMQQALAATSTSKSAIERVLKSCDYAAKDRRAFFDRLREQDILTKKEMAPRWEWRKAKDAT